MISSLTKSGQLLCPGDEIVLTCETSGSNTLTWANFPIIGGLYGQLVFFASDDPGTTRNSTLYDTTVAKLTSNFLENNTRELKSELHFVAIASTVRPTFVNCFHDNRGGDSFSFQTLGI